MIKRKELLKEIQTTLEVEGIKLNLDQLGKVFNTVFTVVGDNVLAAEDSVSTPLGTFKVSNRAARVASNPITKEKVDVPAQKRVVLTTGTKYIIRNK